MNLPEISQRLNDSVLATLRHLLPAGVVQGSEYCVGGLSGEKGQSLRIHMSGAKVGVWSDFASGESGADLIDLWVAVRSITLTEAMDDARQWLGVERPKFIAPKKEYSQPVKPAGLKKVTDSSEVDEYLRSRGIKSETATVFRIAADGSRILFPFIDPDGVTRMIKFRDTKDKKRQGPTSAGQMPILFGWHTVEPNAREVWIVEGEFDAMAGKQMGVSALSVPFGGGKGAKQQWIENEFDNLDRFDTIILALDMDEEGEAAAREIADRLGNDRCRRASLPYKDMNECLLNDVSISDIKIAAYDPEELRCATEYRDDIIRELFHSDDDTRGFAPLLRKFDGKLRFRDAELIILNGINGHGKSQLAGQFSLDAMIQNKRVCIASMEMPARRLLSRLTRQASGITGNGVITERYADSIINWYGGRLWLFDLVGTAKTERMLEVFGYARKRYGIDVFVIDNMSKCGIDDDDYTSQKRFMEALCDFKNVSGTSVFLVTHSRKGESEDTPTGKMDVKGSGAITDLADTVLTIWRNKRKEKKVADETFAGGEVSPETMEEPDSIITCSKQRNGDWEGGVGTYWSPASMQFRNQHTDQPRTYVSLKSQDANKEEEEYI